MFVPKELVAIRADSGWSSQRAAAYFALKEAFYKAQAARSILRIRSATIYPFNKFARLSLFKKIPGGGGARTQHRLASHH